MTCIIGVNCKDGVVLAADRRLIRGKEIFHRKKLFALPKMEGEEFPFIAFGFAGLTGIRDKFLPTIRNGMRKAMLAEELENLSSIIHGVEDNIRALHKRYSSRFGRGKRYTLGGIVGGLTGLSTGEAQIHKLSPIGLAEKVPTFDSIGSAGEHANAFLKLVYSEDKGIDEMARISTLIILLIEGMDIDRNVGGVPDVIKVKNERGIEVVPKKKIKKWINQHGKEELVKMTSSSFQDILDEENQE